MSGLGVGVPDGIASIANRRPGVVTPWRRPADPIAVRDLDDDLEGGDSMTAPPPEHAPLALDPARDLEDLDELLTDVLVSCTHDDARMPAEHVRELYSIVGGVITIMRRMLVRIDELGQR